METETLITKGNYDFDSIEDIKENFPDEIDESEEALDKYISESSLEILKTEFL